eukprot:snap_masked-scaffold268_size230776-processed-gene-1.14 protein:Tk11113 transcript:snap_masked-scaffold268_size230776-processed-gene-1.14-mRNA-1 annotation:"predicted protein"
MGGVFSFYMLRRWYSWSPSVPAPWLSEVLFFPEVQDMSGTNDSAAGLERRLEKNSSLQRLLTHIRSAQKSLDLCLFLITCRPLAQAVWSRIGRGVKVRVILDHASTEVTGSQSEALRARGAFVRSRSMDYLMHHKFCVVDGQRVISGSLNWTTQGVMGNRENVIITEDPALVTAFARHFQTLWEEMAHSR